IVIADRLAVIVDTVYNNPSGYNGIYYIIATVAFAIQIYCDFSGYSDIAIGSARIMGFGLMKNFERPYFSKSVTEFWRRWHISLSTWFRDYLYFPLGGSKKGYLRTLLNLFIIFVVSGLWHGASWTFIIWGALNGAAIVIEKILGVGKRAGKREYMERKALENRQKPVLLRFAKSILGVIPMILTFAFTCFTWIFFRARTLGEAFYMLPRFLQGIETFELNKLFSTRIVLGLDYWEFFTVIGAVIILICIELFQGVASPSRILSKMPSPVRLAIYAFSLSLVIWFAWTETQTFIYFAF
ncbi:MAG: MBOAT family protein, partial [Clostridiaceae bacterium]|nr:MBOAT family protein [Clostridiaceae bacterium]